MIETIDEKIERIRNGIRTLDQIKKSFRISENDVRELESILSMRRKILIELESGREAGKALEAIEMDLISKGFDLMEIENDGK